MRELGRLMTQAQFARQLGVSRQAVSSAVKAGRIRTYGSRKWVRAAEATADWDVNRLRLDFAVSPEPLPRPEVRRRLQGLEKALKRLNSAICDWAREICSRPHDLTTRPLRAS